MNTHKVTVALGTLMAFVLTGTALADSAEKIDRGVTKTLQVLQQQYASQLNLVLVGAMVNAIPVIILFFIFSKYYIEGVSYAGVKG